MKVKVKNTVMRKSAQVGTYEASDITVITEDRKKIQLKPALYLGVNPQSNDAHRQLVVELVGNSLDEYTAGHNDLIIFSQDKDGWIYVADAARGIPVEINKDIKESTLTAVYTRLHSGGKITKDQKGYAKGSIGTFGVGAAVVCALSSQLQVYTYRNKKWYFQEFKDGKETSPVKNVIKPISIPGYKGKITKGTLVRFKSNPKFLGEKTKLNTKEFMTWYENQAYLFPGIKLIAILDNKEQVFHQPRGLQALIEKRIEAYKAEPLGKPFIFQNDQCNVFFQWSTYHEPGVVGYVNGLPTTDEKSSQLVGFNKAFNEAIKPHAGVRNKDNYKTEDLLCGIVAAVGVAIASPEFDSQSKQKLVSREAQDIMYKNCLPALTEFFNKNKNTAKDIIKRACEVREALGQLQLTKKAAADLKHKKGGKTFLSAKGVRASTKDDSKRELTLVEGLSASGTCKQARIPEFQEVLALRGKIVNCYRDKGNKVFDSTEVMEILKWIGYNPESKDPVSELRVARVYLLMDKDPDGAHCTNLVASIFQRLVPKFIEQGRLYVVDAPLFIASTAKEKYLGDTLKEVQAKVPKGVKFSVQRLKGWAEINPKLLSTIAFTPATRKVIQIKPLTKQDMERFIGVVGENAEIRKALLGL